MEENIEIITLLQSKKLLEQELNSITYGSVEIRDNDAKQYIYVHYRENGITLTKYVGEYSEDLYNLILNNSIKRQLSTKTKRNKSITT